MDKVTRHRHAWGGLLAVGTLLAPVTAWAVPMPTTTIVVVAGDLVPDSNGSFTGFDRPALNDAGQASFFAELTGTSGGNSDNSGIFRGSGGVLTQIVRKGQPAPDANGSFASFNGLVLNDAGQVAFVDSLVGTSGGIFDNNGIFRGDGGALTQIAREGQAAPDANGNFSGFSVIALNDAGQTAFFASLRVTSGGGSDNAGIFRGDGGAVTQIVRRGQITPDANGSISGFTAVVDAVNDVGQVAFFASLFGTSDGASEAIFLGDGGTLTQIARGGQLAPDANGSFTGFSNPALNDAGKVAFLARLTGTSGGSSDDVGIFRGEGGALTQIVREGQLAPDANGSFLSLESTGTFVNGAGQVAFTASLTGTSGGGSDDRGIFRGEGGVITQIAREGQAATDNNGSLTLIGDPALNDAGQVAFFARLTGTSGGNSDSEAIYFFDDIMGLLQVARLGDTLLGSSISSLSFNSGGQNKHRSGLNEAGDPRVAFLFSLTDGRQGVAIWELNDGIVTVGFIPEPASASLLLLASVGLISRRYRRVIG